MVFLVRYLLIVPIPDIIIGPLSLAFFYIVAFVYDNKLTILNRIYSVSAVFVPTSGIINKITVLIIADIVNKNSVKLTA